MQRQGNVVPTNTLIHEITKGDILPHPGTIRVHIRNLLFKLGGRKAKSLIRAVQGLGYALRV